MYSRVTKSLGRNETDASPDQKYVYRKTATNITWDFLFEHFNIIESRLYKEIALTILYDDTIRSEDFAFMFKRMHYIDTQADHIRNVENQHFEPLLCSVFALYRQTETVVLNIEKSQNKTIILGIIKCVNIYSSRIPIYIMCYIEKYLDKTVKFVIHCLRQTDIEYTDIVIFKAQLPDTIFVNNIFNNLNINYCKSNYQCSTYFYRRL